MAQQLSTKLPVIAITAPYMPNDIEWKTEFIISDSKVFGQPTVDGDTIVWEDCSDWGLSGFKIST